MDVMDEDCRLRIRDTLIGLMRQLASGRRSSEENKLSARLSTYWFRSFELGLAPNLLTPNK